MADTQLKMWLATPLAQHIKQHIERGFKVFPIWGVDENLRCLCGDINNKDNTNCKDAGKHPFRHGAPHGVSNASDDIEIVAEMFHYRDDLNVGIATGETSNIFVIDVDNKNNNEGDDSLRRISEVLGDLPTTVKFITGNGYHLLFDYPAGEKLKTRTASFGKDYPSVDTRSNGGYIVAPPSRHANGKYYIEDFSANVFADLPRIYIDFLKRDDLNRKNDSIADEDRMYRNGNSSEWSDEEVYRMLDFLDPDMTYMDWIIVGMALHKEGFPMDMWDKWSATGKKYAGAADILKHWRTFDKSGQRTIGTIVEWATLQGWRPSPEHYDRIVDTATVDPFVEKMRQKFIESSTPQIESTPQGQPEAAEEQENDCSFNFDPLLLPGGLGDTIRWINKHAIYQKPELALMNVLSFAGAVFGRRYASPLNTRTNIYFVGIARTGGGKEHSVRMIENLAFKASLTNYIGSHSIRSDIGLLKGLMTNTSQMLAVDEFGKFLQAISDKNANFNAKMIAAAFTKLYSKSGGVYNHGEIADERAKKIIIPCPNLCLYGTTTEEDYIRSLQRSAIHSGELNRFMAIPSKRKGKPRKKIPQLEIDESLIEWWKQFAPGIGSSIGVICNSATIAPEPKTVEWGGLEDFAYEILVEQTEICEREGDPLAPLWSRYYENTIKIAMILAIARNPESPSFSREDFDYAIDIVKSSIHYMESLCRDGMSENPYEATYQEILRFINSSGSGITRTILLRNFRKIKKREMDDILASLIEEESIVIDRVVSQSSKGRPQIVYYPAIA